MRFVKTDVLILGGGLAGLSTAYHLERSGRKTDYLILEKSGRPGGLAGSIEKDGFTFDHTGHLLHLHNPYGTRLILRLLGGNWDLHQRSSWIHSHGVFTRYPFQANTFGLPPQVLEECVVGFLKTVPRSTRPRNPTLSTDYRSWCLQNFGEGISKHFMFPYNEKLWRTDLSRMTTEWQGRFVPKPKPEEVLYGALVDQKKHFGYNAAFRYPKRGGIQALPDALAARVRNLRLNNRVVRVDLRARVAVADGLGEVGYKRLVNTLPLAHFLDLVEDLPPEAARARSRLRWNTVYCFNLGIGRPNLSDRNWIYFPEDKFVFYRAGFYSSFSKSSVPPGASSMYVEVSRRPEERLDVGQTQKRILEGLTSTGILKPSDRLVTSLVVKIPCAYVVYDFDRTPSVTVLQKFLARLGVETIGRYGGWKYSFMEETILDGKACAEKLSGEASRV